MYFTNPTKANKRQLANTVYWAVFFSRSEFNTLESVTGEKIFPASDVLFKELSMKDAALDVGIGGLLDLSTPCSVQLTTAISLPFIDDDDQTINNLIRSWIKESPVYTKGRVLNLHKDSSTLQTLTLFKLNIKGEKIENGKLEFKVFPNEELVQTFNSDPSAMVDKLSLRRYQVVINLI